MKASKDKDERVLREVLADDYSQVTASGDIRDKERRIRDTLSNEALASYTIESFRARVYSDSAVALCRLGLRGADKDGNYNTAILSTVTFIRKDGVWRIAATHLTLPSEVQQTGAGTQAK